MVNRMMWKKNVAVLACAIMFSFLQAILGCATSQKATKAAEALPQEQPFNAELPPDQYAGAIKRMLEISELQSAASDGRKAHLYLAQLYWSHGNPKRNYHLALKHLETYSLTEPEAFQNPEIRNWQTVLSEVVRLSDLHSRNHRQIDALDKTIAQHQRKYQTLSEKLRSCNADSIRLVEKNHELKQTIQEMQRLDLTHEKKRKSYR